MTKFHYAYCPTCGQVEVFRRSRCLTCDKRVSANMGPEIQIKEVRRQKKAQEHRGTKLGRGAAVVASRPGQQALIEEE